MADKSTNALQQQDGNPKTTMPFLVFFKDARSAFKMDELGKEILQIAVPAALALAADPIASLIDTAFIGRIGAVELAAVGVAIAVFNQASKVTIYPLVSITTSFVAEEDTIGRANNILTAKVEHSEKAKSEEMKELALEEGRVLEKSPSDSSTIRQVKESMPAQNFPSLVDAKANNKPKVIRKEKRQIPSASTAIVVGLMLGLIQAILLIFGAKLLLGFMGVKSDSPMLSPATKYLKLRSLGSPAILLSLAMQGVFRGFKDTTTPLYATVVGDAANIILDPVLIFVCRLGVSGAAIAHIISQYLMTLILLLQLMKQVDLLPPSFKSLQFSRFLKNGLPLLGRVIAVTFCVTLAASLAARLGTIPMAAFQICLQVWLASSLLADGLAVAGQAILAGAFAEKNYDRATTAAARVLQMSVVLGMGLAVVVGLGLQFGSAVFTKDVNVVHLISIGVPFVAATQPINSLSFVFDGVNYGASDFSYAAYSMVVVAGISVGSLFLLSKSNGFVGIWIALTIYMFLRACAGIWRMGSGSGPWRFLRGRTCS